MKNIVIKIVKIDFVRKLSVLQKKLKKNDFHDTQKFTIKKEYFAYEINVIDSEQNI